MRGIRHFFNANVERYLYLDHRLFPSTTFIMHNRPSIQHHTNYAVHGSTVTPSQCSLEKSEYCKWGQNKQKRTSWNGRQRERKYISSPLVTEWRLPKARLARRRFYGKLGLSTTALFIYLWFIYINGTVGKTTQRRRQSIGSKWLSLH